MDQTPTDVFFISRPYRERSGYREWAWTADKTIAQAYAGKRGVTIINSNEHACLTLEKWFVSKYSAVIDLVEEIYAQEPSIEEQRNYSGYEADQFVAASYAYMLLPNYNKADRDGLFAALCEHRNDWQSLSETEVAIRVVDKPDDITVDYHNRQMTNRREPKSYYLDDHGLIAVDFMGKASRELITKVIKACYDKVRSDGSNTERLVNTLLSDNSGWFFEHYPDLSDEVQLAILSEKPSAMKHVKTVCDAVQVLAKVIGK